MIVVSPTFGLKFRFTASLLSTLGKNLSVIAAFFVSLHWICHFLMLSFRYPFLLRCLVSCCMLRSGFELPPSQVDLRFRYHKYRRGLAPIYILFSSSFVQVYCCLPDFFYEVAVSCDRVHLQILADRKCSPKFCIFNFNIKDKYVSLL